MIARFPTAGQIKYLLGYVYRKQGKLDEVRAAHSAYDNLRLPFAVFATFASQCTPPQAQKMFIAAHDETAVVRQFQLNCHYEQGYNHFLNMEWHQAIGLLQKFYDSTCPSYAPCLPLTASGSLDNSRFPHLLCVHARHELRDAIPERESGRDNEESVTDCPKGTHSPVMR